jgi:hypothetical protein
VVDVADGADVDLWLARKSRNLDSPLFTGHCSWESAPINVYELLPEAV